jgi:hypothetical protein
MSLERPLTIAENRLTISVTVQKIQRVQTDRRTDRPTDHSHKAASLLNKQAINNLTETAFNNYLRK